MIDYLREIRILILFNFYILSVFNSATVVLSTGGDGFLSMIAATAAATRTTTQAITIPAIAPPDNPLELLLE